MNKKVFIGVDESYDMTQGGYFVLNFFIISSEKEMNDISHFMQNFLLKNKKEEVKSDKTSKVNVLKIIKNIDKLEYQNIFIKTEINNTKNILKENYKKSIEIFSKYLSENYTENKINLKIDTIAGEKFQKECTKILRGDTKNKDIKINFVNSKTNYLIQISDIFASLNRTGDKNKILDKYKNKNI